MNAGANSTTGQVRYQQLWDAICTRLDRSGLEWRRVIDDMQQVSAAESREAGRVWTDSEVFEALLRGVLSNNTDWAKVERVIPELRDAFAGFDLGTFATTTDSEISDRVVPWFKQRKAGSMTLRRSLKSLRDAAATLRCWSNDHGSAEDYFLNIYRLNDSDPKRLVVALGSSSSPRKLPSMGIPIAAECVRNLGFDVCKPDRHLCRAVGAFGMVRFQSWSDQSNTKAPRPTPDELVETMSQIERFALLVGERPTFVDNAIWLLCARSGVHLSNSDLGALPTV